MRSELNQVVEELCRDFVHRLDALNDEPYVREAIMKQAVRDCSWALLHIFQDQHSLADQLSLMGDLVREHRDEGENEAD